jgi:hypothetical protein
MPCRCEGGVHPNCEFHGTEAEEAVPWKPKPVSDFSRFRDLVTTAAGGGFDSDKEAALEELAEDLANVEVLTQIAMGYVNAHGLEVFYNRVWEKKQ